MINPAIRPWPDASPASVDYDDPNQNQNDDVNDDNNDDDIDDGDDDIDDVDAYDRIDQEEIDELLNEPHEDDEYNNNPIVEDQPDEEQEQPNDPIDESDDEESEEPIPLQRQPARAWIPPECLTYSQMCNKVVRFANQQEEMSCFSLGSPKMFPDATIEEYNPQLAMVIAHYMADINAKATTHGVSFSQQFILQKG